MKTLHFTIMIFFLVSSVFIASQEMRVRVELRITGEFPPGEHVEPEIATLDGQDACDHTFLPGKHKLEIRQHGYVPVEEEIEIPKDTGGTFLMERVLRCQIRPVAEKITFDVPPPDNLPPHKITLASGERPNDEQPMPGSIKPGAYILRIRKQAYETIEHKIFVWPSENPYLIERELIASPVVVHISLTYEMEPPLDLDPARVSCIDIKTGIPRYINHGKTIKPGVYLLDIQRPGYSFGPKKRIEILPSEQPYMISEKLFVKPRPISFDVTDPCTGILVPAREIKVGGNPISFKDTFRPGDSLNMNPSSKPVAQPLPALGQPQAVQGARQNQNVAQNQAVIAPHSYNDESAEAYNRIYENPFVKVLQNPLSTFSIDVDTASYSNIRRFLEQNCLPSKDAVRIEEMLNYFEYQYPEPTGDAPFSTSVEIHVCPWKPEHRLIRIGLQGKHIARDKRPPSNLVFLLDVSGSMWQENRLPLVKKSLKLLLGRLTEKDRVAMVVYAGASGLVLPSTPCGIQEKDIIRMAIDNLQAGGSTNGGEGIQLAYDVAAQNFIPGGTNRVILATDGDFNVGVTSHGDLTRLIEEKAKTKVFLTALGFGMGNYKDTTLETLADKGNGNYGYIDSLEEAQKILVDQMSGTLITIAKDVKIQIEFNPSLVNAYRLIGYEDRMLKAEDFKDDKKDAGEIGAGHRVTALYEIVPPGVAITIPDVDPLKYQTQGQPKESTQSDEIMTLKLRYKEPEGDVSKELVFPIQNTNDKETEPSCDFQFVASVAAFGMMLRDSQYKGNITYEAILESAPKWGKQDTKGYRKEFVDLIAIARTLQAEEQAKKTSLPEVETEKPKADADTSAENPGTQPKTNSDTGQKSQEAKPTKGYPVEVKFRNYKTFRANVQVPPGEGPYVIRLPLVSLKRIEFNIRNDPLTLDGIVYSFVFFEDYKPIEDHHVDKERGIGRVYYSIWIEQNTKKIQGLCGYLFWEKEVGLLGSGTGNANRISIPHLIEHCEKVAKMKSISASLAVLSDLTNKPEMLDSLQSQSKKDKETLIQKVKEWKFSDLGDQETQKKVIEMLLNKGKN